MNGSHRCSCFPNTYYEFDPELVTFTVRAIGFIPKGTELNITYMFQGGYSQRTARQAWLQEMFCFKCTCHLCSVPSSLEYPMIRSLIAAGEIGRAHV